MRDFPESGPQEPPESPPLLSGLVMTWPTEDLTRISGVVSLIVCMLAVGGGAEQSEGGAIFFYLLRYLVCA